jgi:hypothetical protein
MRAQTYCTFRLNIETIESGYDQTEAVQFELRHCLQKQSGPPPVSAVPAASQKIQCEDKNIGTCIEQKIWRNVRRDVVCSICERIS